MNSNERLVLVALGSNLGESAAIIEQALSRLQTLSPHRIRRSSLWRTTPVDCPHGSPDFLNAAAALIAPSGMTPESLLATLLAWEKEFGRRPKLVLNEARPLDLDLIAFGEETRNSAALKLPHPRAHLRRFVLEPLSEVAPDFILPGQSRTIAQLLKMLPPDPTMTRLG